VNSGGGNRVFTLVRRAWLALLALGLAVPPGHRAGAAPAAAAKLALVGGTVYPSPGDDAISDAVILIEGALVAGVGPKATTRVPPDVPTIDCTGATITAGFWNSHVHFMERKWADPAKIPPAELTAQLQDMLTRYGVTSVFDTGSILENTLQLRERIQAGDVLGPGIRTAGEVLYPKGGSTPELLLDVIGAMRVKTPEAADAAEAAAAAKALLDAGADGVKLYAATWAPPILALPEAAIRAAADEAHRRGKPVFAHPSNREGLLNAVRGGADVIVHTAPKMGPWDDAIVRTMKAANVALIPTLKLWRYELRHDRRSFADRFTGTAVAQLRAWFAAGGAVLFGTDVGYMNDYDPSDEYALMAEAGLSFRQILAALTTTPAERFGDAKRLGRIAPGFTADLVALDGDPSRDIRRLASVRFTIRGGRVIYRSR
jgi:imidazolonepropionase-like amidohydrolase